jgi:hypothetical protein
LIFLLREISGKKGTREKVHLGKHQRDDIVKNFCVNKTYLKIQTEVRHGGPCL